MDRYKSICYYETFRKNILPVKNVKYHERDKIYLSLGSLVFFKDPFQLKRIQGYSKSNNEANEDEISLNCSIYKNDKRITNVIEVKIRNNKLREVCYGKYKPSTPTRLLATKKGRITLKTNKETEKSDKECVRSRSSKLRAPIIVKINSVLVFKIRRRRSGLRNRLDNSTVSISLDLYVNSSHISTNRKKILVPSNEYNTPRKSSSRIEYNTGCLVLYSKGEHSGSSKDRSNNCCSGIGECCCNVEERKVCQKHITDIIDTITSLIGSISVSTSARGELSGSGTRSIGRSCINSAGYRRYILYRYLQVLYYLLSSEVEICKDAGVPLSMLTFRTVESGSSDDSGSYNHDALCGRVNEMLFRYSGLLAVDSRDLLYIEIPTEFKALQLLFRSSLLSINMRGSGEAEEHKVKICGRWYTYKEINSIVYKYYNQLAKSPNSICLLLRFTDYSDITQYALLQSYLEKLDTTTGNTSSTSTSITSSNVILELISCDFVHLDGRTRRKIISILIKNVHKDLLKRYFRQFLYFLKYDIDDAFFNHVVKVIEGDVELSLKILTTTSENIVYLECLSKYVKHLKKVDGKVLSVIKLEQSFLNIFIRIINSINETRKKYTLRNHYLHVLLSQLTGSKLRRGKFELSIDRERKLIRLSPHVPLITDVDRVIRAIDYRRSYIYKSSNYPLILQLKVGTGDDGNSTGGDGSGCGAGKDTDQRIMLKMNYARNDELCLEVLSLFKHILGKHHIPVLTYKMISVYKNLGYIQLLPTLNGNTTGASGDADRDDAASPSFKENFINSFAVVSILNYLLEVGDRHYENVMLQRNGVVTNFDFNFILGNDPNILKKPPFRFSSGDLEVLERLDAYGEFVERFTLIFGLIRRRYKSVLNLLYSSGVDIGDVNSVEARFMLDLSHAQLSERLSALILESRSSHYPQFIDKWHRFTNLFK
ncbi:uncharacterized protein TOT_010001264 [Theileria orientalis strain Shintoku]|uniref:PI3K/PI4K catalytic domain-containing protein n=1 Tax=Theileria orientalis strain Shintoku TaxID=869250 RepID=J4DNI2_THEOR|nr:uncharacterized protein TOT_010001264 [Theileria orientalis strain Shintoku]BAM39004.1 uncharacterized protein TOT_010001264 [Theileria orientalis strain Shintoku]|eukprot:XP_009689305.1 uncharacterized protein TOT_010001264 [Theileria orientalis strain Shintoku]